MFKQIVVGVDEHAGGRDAIALARELLAPDGELTLAHVYAGDPHAYRAGEAFEGSDASVQVSCLKGRVRRPACRQICAGVNPLL